MTVTIEVARRYCQINYRYNAHKPGAKEKIVDMAINGSGVRDTGRVLKISMNTVMSTFKNSRRDR